MESIVSDDFIKRRFAKKKNSYIVIRCMLMQSNNPERNFIKLYNILKEKHAWDDDFEETQEAVSL